MAISKDVNNTQEVIKWIKALPVEQAQIVNHLRQTILDVDSKVGEQVKWNSPSFFYAGDMEPFNPKDYKRDIVVMNIRKKILLVFPTGATIKDPTGVLEGDFKDGRKIIHIDNLEDAQEKSQSLQQVIRIWLGQVK